MDLLRTEHELDHVDRAPNTRAASKDQLILITSKTTMSQHYWALILGASRARLYAGRYLTLFLHTEYRMPAGAEVSELYGSTDPSAIEAARDAAYFSFLRQIEHDVASALDEDCQPMVVAGSCRSLASFCALARKRTQIVGTVTGDYVAESPADLAFLVWPVLFASLACGHEQHDQALRQ